MTRTKLGLIACAGLAVNATVFGAVDDENELYAQLAVAQQAYHEAITTMQNVGMDIANFEAKLDKLYSQQKRTRDQNEFNDIQAQIERINQVMAVLVPIFEEAEQAMNNALTDIETIQAALNELNEDPDIGTGG